MPDPVLIIGAGPTGLTAALELSRLGIPVRIVDKLAEPLATSRALGVQARTLELLEARGLADELISLGNRAAGGSVYSRGERLFRLDLTRIDSRYRHVLLVPQSDTERVLREAIARHGVAVERGVELVGLAQDALSHEPSPTRAVLRHADGRLELAAAPWLISAEGAHSVVRTTLDLQFEGKTLPDDYALGDLQLDGDIPSTDLHIFSSEHGLLALFPLGGRHFRVIASNPPGSPDRAAPPTLQELQAIYDQRSHIPARLHDLGWASWFRINSRMVSRLKIGRLLLGGDSAHIHSPAGGQGMNTGIQDMINLGWKLALVMKGQTHESLLDTYEQDRLPVMRDVLSRTEALTDAIGSENHLLRGLFNHLGPLIGGAGIVQEAATARLSQTALGYRASRLSANHAHDGSLHAGDRVPDLSVRVRRDGAWHDAALFALLDPSRFVLLAAHWDPTGSAAPGLDDAIRPWRDLISIVEISAGSDEAASARFESAFGRAPGAFLVRPDGYVGLAAGEHGAAGHLRTYCNRWLIGSEQDQTG